MTDEKNDGGLQTESESSVEITPPSEQDGASQDSTTKDTEDNG